MKATAVAAAPAILSYIPFFAVESVAILLLPSMSSCFCYRSINNVASRPALQQQRRRLFYSGSDIRSKILSTGSPQVKTRPRRCNEPRNSRRKMIMTAAAADDDPARSPPPIRAFPSSRFRELRSEHGAGVKLLHVVRHAEGTHNVNHEYSNPVHADARLTRRGAAQCAELAASLESERPRRFLHSRSLDGEGDGDAGIAVVTSPMTRCIQTAMLSFPGLLAAPGVPFVAHEGFRETVNYDCDRRRTVSELSADYGGDVDFSLLAGDEADPVWERYRRRLPPGWDRHMESADLANVVDRAWDGLSYVAGRPEREIVVCSHSAFLRCVLNHGQMGGIPQSPPQDLAASFIAPHDAVKKNGGDSGEGDGGKREPSPGAGEENSGTRTAVRKIFEYDDTDGGEFEEYMRRNYENCELRSFCLLFPSSFREASSSDL